MRASSVLEAAVVLLAAGCLLASCQLIAGKPRNAAPETILPTPTATLVTAPKPSTTLVVKLLDTKRFDPSALSGRPGELVKLVLVGDRDMHDFTSPGLNVNIDVPPQSVQVILVQLPAVDGSYDFWSHQPGDREGGMTGKFTVSGTASPPA